MLRFNRFLICFVGAILVVPSVVLPQENRLGQMVVSEINLWLNKARIHDLYLEPIIGRHLTVEQLRKLQEPFDVDGWFEQGKSKGFVKRVRTMMATKDERIDFECGIYVISRNCNKHDQDLKEILLSCLSVADGDVRKRAASTLECFIDDERVVDSIGSRVDDSSGANGNSFQLIRSLSVIARISRSKSIAEKAKGQLDRALHSEIESIRKRAEQELAMIQLKATDKDTQIAPSADQKKKKRLLKLLNDRDPKARSEAIEKLVHFPNDRDVVNALASRLDDALHLDPNLIGTYMSLLASDNLTAPTSKIAKSYLRNSSRSKTTWIRDMAILYLAD